jgi:hypothetical protein
MLQYQELTMKNALIWIENSDGSCGNTTTNIVYREILEMV